MTHKRVSVSFAVLFRVTQDRNSGQWCLLSKGIFNHRSPFVIEEKVSSAREARRCQSREPRPKLLFRAAVEARVVVQAQQRRSRRFQRGTARDQRPKEQRGVRIDTRKLPSVRSYR